MSSESIFNKYKMINGIVECRYCNLQIRMKGKTQKLINHSAKCNKTVRRECVKQTNRIAEMMITDTKPLSLVDDAIFKKFIHSVDPDCKIPSLAEFSDVIIPKRHEDLMKQLEKNINREIKGGKMTAAFAINTWTSVDSYVSVEVHYITEDFKLCSYMLAVELLPRNDVSASVHNVLLSTLETWKFKRSLSSVFCITNAPNIDEYPDIPTTYTYLPCFDTCLQSAVISVLKYQRTAPTAGSKFIKKCMRTIQYFSRSVSARRTLTERCSDYNIKSVELIEKVDTTCWISMYTMFKCLIRLREPLTDTLVGEIKNFSEGEWTFMENVAIVLELIKEATEIIHTEKYPTLSLYYPTYRALENKLENFDRNSEISKRILRALQKEFKGFISIDALSHATLLDPRFKDEPFTKDSVHSLKEGLRQKIISLHIDNQSGKIKPENEAEFNKSVDQELKEYWSGRRISKKTNIINWWKLYRKRLPILASAARHFLVIPAVRVSGKRFLALRSIIQNNQTKLSLETLQKLCFLHANHELYKKT
ncbi:zinc finger BED domain-containing protein 4-like [Megalopta genalis]|uniref:zinc finger BED domain-containing protein 4-like n=1 Tax=Megalopta genalis TaxID=115081 RepID=UPI003FD1BF3C